MTDFAVIFDMDGVLFDTESLVLSCWLEAGIPLGLTNIPDVFSRCIGCNKTLTYDILLNAYGKDFPKEAFDARVHELYLSHVASDGIPVKKGVFEILSFLQEQHIPIALGSSTRIENVTWELKATGLWDFFSAVIGGDLVKHSKPAPDVFLAAAEKLSFLPENCYVIEDSYNGIRAAFAAGMHPLMVPDLLPPNDEIRNLAERVFPSLLELKSFFASFL